MKSLSGPRSIGCLVLLTLAAFLQIPIAGSIQAGEEQSIDGTLHIINGTAPDKGIETVVLEELWRAGGDDDSENFFGLVTRVVSDADGTLYLLDPPQQLVHVYSADGIPLSPLFRQGEGPGEIGFVRDLCLLPGVGVAAFQMSKRTLVKMGRDGVPLGDVEIENKGAQFLMPCSAVGRD